jgi:hypothetical protein
MNLETDFNSTSIKIKILFRLVIEKDFNYQNMLKCAQIYIYIYFLICLDTVKLRSKSATNEERKAFIDQATKDQKTSIEDELKWVEDNVPQTLIESAVPGLIDSEEEQQSTKLEMSKMD